MSNSKRYSEGNKGSDLSYRGKVLKGLQAIANNTRTPGVLADKTRTPGVLDITNTAGSTLGTWQSFTFVCVAGTVDIGTETFPVGTYSFSNGNGTLTSIAYDASNSTDCKIIFVA
mgnify:FL=1